MGSIFDAVGRAERQHAVDAARLDNLQGVEASMVANRPDAAAFDELVRHDQDLEAQRRKVAIAEGVAQHSAGLLERARAEAATRDADNRHAAIVRDTKAAEKRMRSLFDLQKKLATELAWAAEHVEAIDAYNRNERGDRSYVRDAEDLVRRQPDIDQPATFALIDVWVDAQGHEARQFVDRDGEMVPAGMDHFKKVKREVCTGAPRYKASEMPTRLVEAVRLVDVDGRSLWPIG